MNEVFSSEFHLKQTHMVLKCDFELGIEKAKSAVSGARLLLENYMSSHPDFKYALTTEKIDPIAPEIVRKMMEAGQLAGVGPMASVAGALSEVATNAMISIGSQYALSENGGDISVKGTKDVKIGIYAGNNKSVEKVGFKVKVHEIPLGICTSAGEVGPSLSLGEADAVIIFSKSACLADAAATSCANMVKKIDPEGSIQKALEKAETIEGVKGCIVFIGPLVGRWGNIPEMVEVIDYDL